VPTYIYFGELDGRHVSPEKVTRNFGQAVAPCRKDLPELPALTFRGLRHTHASLDSGVPVKTISARLGHSTPLVTMTVYSHLLGRADEEAADTFAGLVGGGEVLAEYHGPDSGPARQAGEGR
jgi:integrase